MSAEYELFIGGQWQPAATGETFERENPATGEPIGRIPRGSEDDADRAVVAAADAHQSRAWQDVPGARKQQLLRGIADWLREHVEGLTALVSAEAGKPVAWARFDVLFAADYFDYYSGLVRDVGGRTIPALRPDLFAYTLKEPAGVAGIITPWNFPLLIAAQKTAPALAAGCPVVLKPAPQTPLTALELARAFEELDFPRGVFNVVTDTGPGSPVGARLCSHPAVAAVSFTGSTGTGARVMEACAPTMKRVALECGGKSPMLVHDDADLEAAVDGALFGIFFNTGQVCNASSRVLLHDSIADEFLSLFVERAGRLRVGKPTSEDTQIGPLISREQMERVLSYVELGKAEGAELVLGGEQIMGDLESGYFVAPTVFDRVDESMRLAQDEVFGPVLAVGRYHDLSEAIERANATPFGLAAGVWTRSIDVADRVTRELNAGMVWVNEWLAMFPETPHGGYGMSGVGREMGPEALHEFQENKTVIQKTGRRELVFA
ncbi:MAG: aldehyde dehydrogenase family protein [Gaiella sp.]|nr:aldehyde dehydrogenase family protein [Gaiella sp.]